MSTTKEKEFTNVRPVTIHSSAVTLNLNVVPDGQALIKLLI